MGVTPEFSRRFALDTIGAAPRTVSIEASERECAALAGRFGLVALDSLDATATLVATSLGVEVRGQLSAQVVQACVVTDAPVPARLEEDFALRFVDPALLATDVEEVELSDADCDVVELDAGGIDLGEAVAQTLGLALDPFPRAPAERARADERKWAVGEDAGPFAGLKDLLGKAP